MGSEQTFRDVVSLPTDSVWEKEFSICCLVTRWGDYAQVRTAFAENGFRDEDCEYLVCDNSERNRFSAYEAVRSFLRNARGRYVLMIHQDAFPKESCKKLRSRLAEVEAHDPMWGVIGNAGKSRKDPMTGFLSLETHAGRYELGRAFEQVDTLDENVLIVKNGTNITVSADLDGFHLYAFDLCSIAARLGYTCYVIEFQWKHLSPGSIDESFLAARRRVEEKMRNYDSHGRGVTTCTSLHWGDGWRRGIASACCALVMLERQELHRAGFESLRRELRQKWFLFDLVYFFYTAFYHSPEGHFARSIPLRVYQWGYARYRVLRKRIGWERDWWRKNWRSRLGR